MGCGPGNLTVTLAKWWWLSATVVGVDSSPEITVAAGSIATDHAPGLSFMRDDIRHWKPQSMPDVVDSAAVAYRSA
jgi:trans-aconitate 2-methyltransferase